MRKIVFAGGTHSGKTSLVEHFEDAGYRVVSESGIEVVNEMIDELGWEGYRSWRKQRPDEFVYRIALRQIENEKNISEGDDTVFFDRGILDYAAMARHLGRPIPPIIVQYAKQNRYDLVFLCDTLAAEDVRVGEGRFFTTEDSLHICRYADMLYREYGYEPVHLPDVPIGERIRIIGKTLDQ